MSKVPHEGFKTYVSFPYLLIIYLQEHFLVYSLYFLNVVVANGDGDDL
jgi:hypothetical protein